MKRPDFELDLDFEQSYAVSYAGSRRNYAGVLSAIALGLARKGEMRTSTWSTSAVCSAESPGAPGLLHWLQPFTAEIL